jgi:hypothetical protein
MDGEMPERVLRPEGKGFLFLDAHPAGCALTVEEMAAEAGRQRAASGLERRALVIGCSAGYGLAAAVTGLFGYGAATIGLCYERAATARRSASAGWYRTAALAGLAAGAGLRFEAVNGDCFDPAVRASVLDRVAAALGPLDAHLQRRRAAPDRPADRRRLPLGGAAHRGRLPGQERGIRRWRRAARRDGAASHGRGDRGNRHGHGRRGLGAVGGGPGGARPAGPGLPHGGSDLRRL